MHESFIIFLNEYVAHFSYIIIYSKTLSYLCQNTANMIWSNCFKESTFIAESIQTNWLFTTSDQKT